MKNLYFLRHAKSSWDDYTLKDFDRPLSTRGIQDADLMGNFFKSKRAKIDIILASPSKRTIETIEHFFGNKAPDVKFDASIYHASLDDVLKNIYAVPEEVNSVMVVGHNPSMHDATEFLTQKFLNKFPTCGLASLNTENKWNDLNRGSAELNYFMKPRELR